MHSALPPELPAPVPTPKSFQFGVRHLIAVMAAVCVVGAAYQWIGPGALMLAGFLLVVTLFGLAISNGRWQGAMAVVVAVGGFVALCVLPNFRWAGGAREAARRSQCSNNLKQIVLALHNYHDVYKSLPPAYIADENGKPLHSWRVLILPFMEQKALYDKYRLDEPWDGPNNCQLAAELKAFVCPSDQRGLAGQTSYVAVVGPGTAWPGAKSVKLEDITDGTANTILVVEVHGSGIHWMEPRDLDASQMLPAINAKPAAKSTSRGISSGHPGVAQAALADGSVRALADKTPPATVRAMLTIAGGEKVEPP